MRKTIILTTLLCLLMLFFTGCYSGSTYNKDGEKVDISVKSFGSTQNGIQNFEQFPPEKEQKIVTPEKDRYPYLFLLLSIPVMFYIYIKEKK